jgi:hypothetical protein
LVSILSLPRLNNIGMALSWRVFLTSCEISPRVCVIAAILLSRFKISEEEIKSAILAMDDTVLTVENVTALLYITPKDDEVRALRAFREKMDPTTPLGKVERFIFTVRRTRRVVTHTHTHARTHAHAHAHAQLLIHRHR